jgi:cytochrome c556
MKQKFVGISGRLAAVVGVSATLLIAATAHAQFAKPEDAIKYRQSAFTVAGTHFARLAAMARGTVPYDAAKAQESAKIVDTVMQLPWEAFVPTSGGAPAKMKGDPLANMGDVKQLSEKLLAETAKLPGAAGNLESLKTQVGATGAACKSCHDKYRQTN